MSATFNLTLDTQAPANPSLLINDGAPVTGDRTVWVRLATVDYLTGANDVSQMKVWGDVETSADPAIAPTEIESEWLAFSDQVAVVLSTGEGRKHLYAKFRDDVGNETLTFTDFIDFSTLVPVVTITTAPDRTKISKVAPFSTATFVWEANVDFEAFEVRVVPNAGSPHLTGIVVGTAHGSSQTSGPGVTSHTPVTTVIEGADLEAASPGDTTKVLKVFVRLLDGTWSA